MAGWGWCGKGGGASDSCPFMESPTLAYRRDSMKIENSNESMKIFDKWMTK